MTTEKERRCRENKENGNERRMLWWWRKEPKSHFKNMNGKESQPMHSTLT